MLLQVLRVSPLVLEERGETGLGNEAAVLREHGEEDAHEEAAGRLGIEASLLDAAGDSS